MENNNIEPKLSNRENFPQIKAYVLVAIFFIDIGILFGGLNALRLAQIFNVPEIHQTHWTSTLFGGMTVIMMGQLLYFISLSIKFPNWIKFSSIIILILILLAAVSNYIQVWIPGNQLGSYFVRLIKLASLLYILLILYLGLLGERIHQLRNEPSYILIFTAIFWMAISQLVYLGYRGVIGPTFRVTYIYGFFSLTLFGSLSFVLPRLTNTKTRPLGTTIRDTAMISLSAFLLLLNELVESYNTLLGLLGTVFWGLVGFLFILYIFDLMFKSGISNSLLGLSVALVMFGFFVFDTLMKAIFPHWVNASHAHFMFLGTLVITIISVGVQLIGKEIDKLQIGDRELSILLVTTVVLIGIILIGFTLQMFALAGYTGIVLFAFLVLFELYIIMKILL